MSGLSHAGARVPGEERVFSLVLALVSSPQGLTKSDLLSSVYGYAQRYRAGEADAKIERQFERDKEQVRRLGIPIETLDSPLEPGNNRLTRYRISKERLQLPHDVRFTSDELAVLRLASLAWSDGSLGAESRWATMKLASLGAGLDVRHLGIAPRLGIPEPAAPALQLAIDEGRAVRFDYQLPDRDEPLERRVAPLRLHRAEGRWHLISHDLDRDDSRVFLLSRISSEVRVLPERFDDALRLTVDDALEGLLALRQQQRVTVAVSRGSVAEARLESRGDTAEQGADAEGDLLREFGTLDLHALADELAGYGDEVEVRQPERLREAVVDRLRLVRQQHAAEREAHDRA